MKHSKKTGRITGPQLQKLLDGGELSQRGAAIAIGINERTMRKYIAGEAVIPVKVEFALRWLVHTRGTGQEDGRQS